MQTYYVVPQTNNKRDSNFVIFIDALLLKLIGRF